MLGVMSVKVLISFTAVLLGIATGAANSALSQDQAAAVMRNPVSKVIRMLLDMKTEIQKELDADKQVYEQLECWCKTNKKQKEQAVELGTSTVQELQTAIQEDNAKVEELKSQKKSTNADLDDDRKALDSASQLRMKESQAYSKEAGNIKEAIKANEQALSAMGAKTPALTQVRTALKSMRKARVTELVYTYSTLDRFGTKLLQDFVMEPLDKPTFLAMPGANVFSPESAQIVGVLTKMQTDFKKNLAAAKDTEAKAQNTFQALEFAKKEEIVAGRKQISQINNHLADLGEKIAEEKKELENTETQLASDREFLGKLEKQCQATDNDYEARTKSRMAEIGAVEDTIKILNHEDLIGATPVAFLQTTKVTHTDLSANVRKKVAAAFIHAARLYDAPRLALLAASTRTDAMKKVVDEIDKLTKDLKDQQADELKKRDTCNKDLARNAMDTDAAYSEKSSLQTRQADKKKELETLSARIKASKTEMKEIEKEMFIASSTREAENTDFQQTIADQRLTQSTLSEALGKMKQVYVQYLQYQDSALQQRARRSAGQATPEAPTEFKKYEQNAGGSKVIAMIEAIIEDSKKTESQAMFSEMQAQQLYESFMVDSNKSLKQHQESLADYAKAKAKAEEDFTTIKGDLTRVMDKLEGLNTMLGDLRQSCDFLIKNYAARQEARSAEIADLQEQRGMLLAA